MKPLISKENVNELFRFVESKNVPFKDVQFEIVDHLASGIEEEMIKDQNLNFNSALTNSSKTEYFSKDLLEALDVPRHHSS